MKPTIIGIGAQKCASSWLHSIAGSHPEIGTSTPKEVDFFSYYFDRGYRWYESHFWSSGDKAARFESSPSYLHDPRSPSRARAYRADLKVLALLRDPIARAYSNHMHEIIKGHIQPCSFEEGLANNPSYVEQGLYATHLARWFDAFPDDQIMILFAEDIVADPGGSARAVFEFVGVDPSFDSPILHERRNESDRPRFPLLRSTLRAGGDWMRRRSIESLLAKIKSINQVDALLRANKIEIRDEIPPMSPDMKAVLTDVFAPEADRLRKLLGREHLPWDRDREEAAAQ